jgi:hypothetical protein
MARKVGWAEAFLAAGAAFFVGAIVNVVVWLIGLFDRNGKIIERKSKQRYRKGRSNQGKKLDQLSFFSVQL